LGLSFFAFFSGSDLFELLNSLLVEDS